MRRNSYPVILLLGLGSKAYIPRGPRRRIGVCTALLVVFAWRPANGRGLALHQVVGELVGREGCDRAGDAQNEQDDGCVDEHLER